jgi:hypothetical protein
MSKMSTFEKFGELSAEIRVLVWQAFLRDETSKRFVLLLLPAFWEAYQIAPTQYLNSPLLAVNNESRHEARSSYSLRLPVYDNPTADLSFIRRKVAIFTAHYDRDIRTNYDRRMQDQEARKSAIRMYEHTLYAGRQLGIVYLNPKLDTFVRGLPNMFFKKGPFGIGDGFGTRSNLHGLDEPDFMDVRDQSRYFSLTIPCMSAGISAKCAAQVSRLAMAQRVTDAESDKERWRKETGWLLDDKKASGEYFWDKDTFPNVTEHFTLYTEQLQNLTLDLLERPEEVVTKHEMRRWMVSDMSDQDGTVKWLMGKSRTDGAFETQIMNKPREFDAWETSNLGPGLVPSPHYTNPPF